MSKPIISVAEELNIFSELPVTLFDRKRNTQISDTLTRFKDIFFKYIMKNNIKCPLPKLHHSVDEDSDLVKIGIKRNNVIATLYFSFEKEERESSFGFVWNDTEKLNFYTMSGNLELNDLNKMLRDIYEKSPDCRCDRDGKVVSFQPCKLGSSVPRSTGSGT